MHAMGFAEMMVLIAMGGGSVGGDLVSFLPAEIYFQSRNIQVNADKMMELAGAEPKDAKAQLVQLLALRTLAERPELITGAKNKDDILKTLHRIAKGETAKDKQGFAPEYAARALLALGQKITLPAAELPGRDEAVAWFPASATLVGAIAPRAGQPPVLKDPAAEMRKLFTKMMPPKEWERVFTVVELTGNLRIQRVAFAYADDDKDGDRFYVRLTGKGNAKGLVDAIRTLNPGEKVSITESQDAKGTPLITISEDGGTPTVVFVGDSDCIIAGRPGGKARERDARTVMTELLDVRAGKAGNVTKGKLQPILAKISDKAIGFVAGDVPAEMRKHMSLDGVPAPRSVRAEVSSERDGLDTRFHAEMDSPDDAKKAVAMIVQGQKQALDGLQKVQNLPGSPLPASTVAALKRSVESLQVRAEGNRLEGGVFVPAEALQSLPSFMLFGFTVRDVGGRPQAAPAPPPPPPPQARLATAAFAG